MKLRLFPQEPAGLKLLSQMAQQIVLASATLAEILGVPADEHAKLVEDMHNIEAKSAELHFALLTHMRSSFVNPLPREDMYALSRYLNEAMEKMDAAAELVALYKLDRLPKRAADQLYAKFQGRLDKVAIMHGDLPQPKRDKVLAGFRAGKVRLLIATDVVGRGIDISGISHIVNYDVPEYCDD